MSWGRIKTILIILFLCTDIFLAASIFVAEKKESEISPEVYESAIEILKNHNITLNESAVLPKVSSAPVLQADNVVTDYDTFARTLLGEDYFLSEDGRYSSENGELYFIGDRFSFKSYKNAGNSEALTQKKAQKKVFLILKGLGFNMSDAKVISESENGGIRTFKIRDFAESSPVFSSELEIAFADNEILSLIGSWFNKKDTREQDGSIKSITGVLIDFATNCSYTVPANIDFVEFGYSVFDSENYHKSASLIPVDRITLSDKTEYLIDARGSWE
ncbi:MAG: hypothetical protein IK057_02095 [Clostridia bacterium]|nr:hypothetical protein [Clostridia bacterium]